MMLPAAIFKSNHSLDMMACKHFHDGIYIYIRVCVCVQVNILIYSGSGKQLQVIRALSIQEDAVILKDVLSGSRSRRS